MYKRLMLVLLVGIVVALPLSSANASEIIFSPSEMIQWDPDKAYNGYNAVIKSGVGYLLDMEGYIVNTWQPVDTGLGGYLFAMENGRWRVAPGTSGREIQSGDWSCGTQARSQDQALWASRKGLLR